MRAVFWALLVGVPLGLCGCAGQGRLLPRAQAQPPAAEQPPQDADNQDLKSRFLRALVAALNDTADNEDQGSGINRDQVREMIHQADQQLSQVLEQHPREAILRANCRLPEVVIEPVWPRSSPEASAVTPAAPSPSAPATSANLAPGTSSAG